MTAAVLALALTAVLALAACAGRAAFGLRLSALPSVLAAVPVLALALALPQWPMPTGYSLWTLALLPILYLLALFDAETKTVPDVLTLPLIGIGLLHAWLNVPGASIFAATSLGVIGLGLIAGFFLPNRLRAWFGGGDVLLLSGSLAWLGPFVIGDLLALTGMSLGAMYSFGVRQVDSPTSDTTATETMTLTTIPLAPALGLATAILWLGGPIF